MIFTKEHCELIPKGLKDQTRRLVQPGDVSLTDRQGNVTDVYRHGRLIYRVGNTYAIQPGRGKKSIGRILITAIRRERLQEISHDDIGREGIQDIWPVLMNTAYLITGARNENELRRTLFRDAFAALWDSINKKKGTRWEDNPDVWVLTFEAVK